MHFQKISRQFLLLLSFTDHLYDEDKTTQELFYDLAKPIVTSALQGINGTIFAYDQTSSEKVRRRNEELFHDE
jgi:Kinesin motor domain